MRALLLACLMVLLGTTSGYSQGKTECWTIENHPDTPSDLTVWLCGDVSEATPEQVAEWLPRPLEHVTACLTHYGFSDLIDPARLEGLRVRVVQEIVPLRAGAAVFLVVGYYDIAENTIYLRNVLPPRLSAEQVFAHELIHALTGKIAHEVLPYEACTGI